VNGWKVEVNNGDIVIGILDLPDCLPTIRSRLDPIAFTEERVPEAFAAVAIVIHHQYPFCLLPFYPFTHFWLSGWVLRVELVFLAIDARATPMPSRNGNRLALEVLESLKGFRGSELVARSTWASAGV
jgi:hypothetical protein